MHYVIFSANHLPNIGGIERFTDGLSGALAQMGHQVTIVTNNTFGLSSYETLQERVDIVRFPCFPLIGGRMPIPKFNSEFKGLWNKLMGLCCDGVLINARFYVHTLLGLKLAKIHGLTPVVLDHGSAYLTFGNPIIDVAVKLYEHCITSLVKLAKPDFYGISQKSVEWLRHFGIQAKGVISNSIDAKAYRAQASRRVFREELGIPDDNLMLAFTGRFIPEKGISVLIEMMGILENDPVHLVMAGDGPLSGEVDRAGLDKIHVVGRLDAPDIAALLMESDLFCLPTRSEGFSTSLLEAAACGTPFLATDVGGARELALGSPNWEIVPSPDARVFADRVEMALCGKLTLEEVGEINRVGVESEYSWPAVARQVDGVLRRGVDNASSIAL